MVWQSYSEPSFLYFNRDYSIMPKEGVQQGDPVVPLLFSLGIMDLMQRSQSGVSLWYLDDRIAAGSPKTAHSDLSKILAASDSLGPTVNSAKV